MYPNLFYVFKQWFGVDLPFLKIFNTFGFFVAIAFIAAAYILNKELKRKYTQGLLTFSTEKQIVGKGMATIDWVVNFVVGFIFGFKILGVLTTKDALNDPPSYLLSWQGNVLYGLLLGLLAVGFKYYEVQKQKLPKPEERIVKIYPHDRVGDLLVLAFIFGFIGAKVFHNLENWNDFVKDPIGALISFDGLTFYGGLICAAIAIYVYAKKYNITFIHLCDAIAPALMVAYAIGRLGCQCSGDGDWGIVNSAFTTTSTGDVIAANAQSYAAALQQHHAYLIHHFGSIENVHHLTVQPVSWLPQWIFGYNYPHNVLTDGVPLENCVGWDKFCNALPFAVFPTPFYEAIICFIFFLLLMSLRSKIKYAGVMFGIYLMMNGFERFWVEKIRVNTVYDIFGFHPTQAEIISTVLFLGGLLLIIFSLNKKEKLQQPEA